MGLYYLRFWLLITYDGWIESENPCNSLGSSSLLVNEGLHKALELESLALVTLFGLQVAVKRR
jgi:hypothetical protein